jgi:hypothetical protein
MREQLAERFAKRQDLLKFAGGEIRACTCGVRTFSAELQYAHHPSFRENRRADDFLDSFGAFVPIFTPSNTLACRTAAKLFTISARFSRAVRAASAELLESGM